MSRLVLKDVPYERWRRDPETGSSVLTVNKRWASINKRLGECIKAGGTVDLNHRIVEYPEGATQMPGEVYSMVDITMETSNETA